MIGLRTVAIGCLTAVAALSACAAAAPEKPAKPEQYFGKWVGKWDGKWPVEFTFWRDGKTKELRVIYAHAEQVGEPLDVEKSIPDFENGVMFVGDSIEVTLSTADPNIATAKGNFKKPRVAVLARDFAAKLPKE